MVNSREEMSFPGVEDFLRNQCFGVVVNMNDTFAWGCGDSEGIGVHDLGEALRLHKKYGSAGLDAFVIAKRRSQWAKPEWGHSEDIKPYYPKEYWEKLEKALEELKDYEVFPGAVEEYGESNRFDDFR